MMEKTIYELELHESMHNKEQTIYITRVPGGWLYEVRNTDGAGNTKGWSNPILVPFHNEFMPTKDYSNDDFPI